VTHKVRERERERERERDKYMEIEREGERFEEGGDREGVGVRV
jgi:hypothetical protein